MSDQTVIDPTVVTNLSVSFENHRPNAVKESMKEAKLVQGYLKQFNKKKSEEGYFPWFFNYEIKSEGFIDQDGHAVVGGTNLAELVNTPLQVMPHITLSGTYVFFKYEKSNIAKVDDKTRRDIMKELISWMVTKGQADKIGFNEGTIITEERILTWHN